MNNIINKITMALTLLLTAVCLTGTAGAQDRPSSSRYLNGVDLATAIEAARSGRVAGDPKILAEVKSIYSPDRENPLVSELQLIGTWNVTVPGPTPEETFYSLQTFGLGGTFSETSSLLGHLSEGPAHGVYECRARGCTLTFEVFEFMPDGTAYGKLRLRNALTLPNLNHFTSNFAVDFVEFDGTVIPDIGTGTLAGERMRVRGL